MKPIVHFKPSTLHNPKLGLSTYVFPIDHPDSTMVSNTGLVRTSPIVSIGPGDEFETENTRYRPVPVEAGQPNVGDE